LTQTIQQRIRQRREAFGASIGDMAEWATLPAERWQAIESGESLSVAELGQVARALAIDPGTFLRGEERNVRRSVARFRQAANSIPGMGTLESRTLALAAELGRIGGGLYRLLGRPLPLSEMRKTEPVGNTDEPWKQGYRLGAAARRSLKIPVGPIVDLQTMLEGLGIHVATLAFSEPFVDAASLMEDGAMPIILLNQSSPRVELSLPRRATMAHELCHLLHDAGEQNLETRLSGENFVRDDGVERRARAFAPAFLAPRDEVQHWFRSGSRQHYSRPQSRVLALAKRWGLSWEGAVRHAKNCRLIQSATASRLVEESVHSEWRTEFEPGEVHRSNLPTIDDIEISPLCRGHLADLVMEAYEAGAISRGRAREISTWG
jgi:Zn-dependent peptidase ImmA (M78 family)